MTTEELINQQKFWTKREQQRFKKDSKFKSDSKHLTLKENAECIYKYQGRIQGHYHVYLTSKSLLSEKLIFHAHLKTIHGVNITMTNIRENYWIPGLRQPSANVMDVKDSRVKHSQHQFLGTYQKLVLNKTYHLNLLEQIMQAKFIAKLNQKKKWRFTYCYLHVAFPEPFTWKY